MKKFLLSIFCLFSILSYATADEVTFVAEGASFSGENSVTMATGSIPGNVYASENIELSLTQKSSSTSNVNSNGHVRWYKYDILNVTAKNGAVITGIVFNTTGGANYCVAPVANSGTATADASSFTITWSGEVDGTLELAADNGQIRFTTMTVTYTAGNTEAPAVSAPEFSVENGTYYNPFSVELTAEEGADIYYTLDGTEPTAESTLYSEAIAISEFNTTTTIKAATFVEGEWSNIVSATYSLKVAAPEFSIDGGVYEKLTGLNALKFTTQTSGATILYNNRGGDPKTEGSRSYGSLSILVSATVKAVAFVKNAEGDSIFSDVVEEKYYISEVKPFEKATEFVAGRYIIACDGKIATPLAEKDSYGRFAGKDVEVNGNFIETNAHYAFTFTEVEGGYTIQDTFGRYIYATYNSSKGYYYNTVNVGDETKIDPAESAAIWTVSIDEEGKATITNTLSGYTFNYSSSYKNFDTQAENAVLPSLYAAGEYPTLTVTPENWGTVPAFDKVTVTCEQGIAYNESDELYAYYTIGWDYTQFEFDNVNVVDNNTIEFSFTTPIENNGDYRVTFPAGLFTLNPSGLAIASEETSVNLTVENPNILEVIYANPDNGAKVKAIEYLSFDFNQSIKANIETAVIKDANGNEYTLSVSNEDSYGSVAPYTLCLKAEVPITTPGEYTFVLKKEYVSADNAEKDIRIANDLTYKFTVTEGLKITNILPAEGTKCSSIDEIIIECNQDINCNAEYFIVKGEDGTEYNFVPTYSDRNGNEIPLNTIRLVSETPITAAGAYTLYIEEYAIANTDWMNQDYLKAQTFTFTFDGNEITTDIENVERERGETTIYDLTGRKIEEISESGIYIINGKKVLVK